MVSIQPHILLIAFPVQSHINPSFQFAKQLLRLGVKVTFATSVSAVHRMNKTSKIPEGLNFAAFSDGFDDGDRKDSGDPRNFLNEFMSRGSKSLNETILSYAANEGPPVTCLVYTIFLHWAADVAREHHVPSALLWVQPASVLDIFYYHFNGYNEIFADDLKAKPSWSIELPGLPLLRRRDIPSFSLGSEKKKYLLLQFKRHIDLFDAEEKPKVLVNTFDALEADALKAVDKLNMIAVGPLIPSAFLGEKDPSDTCFGGDLFEKSKDDYVEWMDSKPEGSIIYISFGSILTLPKKQIEEVAHALLEIKRPFLWVIRDNINGEKKREERSVDVLSCTKELQELGMIVPWCNQLEVLSHQSLGCFVTHCGWNSTLESVVCGVPVVAFPQWMDQVTNAKLVEDVWRTGARVTADEEGFVKGEEIRRCIEMVMGGDERGFEMRENAKKWKELGREAMKEGGSSDMNLKAFVDEVGVGSSWK